MRLASGGWPPMVRERAWLSPAWPTSAEPSWLTQSHEKSYMVIGDWCKPLIICVCVCVGGFAANYQLLCPMIHFASNTLLVHVDHSDHILISSYPVWEATVLFPPKYAALAIGWLEIQVSEMLIMKSFWSVNTCGLSRRMLEQTLT